MVPPIKMTSFTNDEDRMEKYKAFGLLGKDAKNLKHSFLYKGAYTDVPLPCRIIGYETPVAVVIEFEDGRQHVIHPRYLRDMQSKNFIRNQEESA